MCLFRPRASDVVDYDDELVLSVGSCACVFFKWGHQSPLVVVVGEIPGYALSSDEVVYLHTSLMCVRVGTQAHWEKGTL